MEVAAKLVDIKAGLSTLVEGRLVADPRRGRMQVIRVRLDFPHDINGIASEDAAAVHESMRMNRYASCAGSGWPGAFHLVREAAGQRTGQP